MNTIFASGPSDDHPNTHVLLVNWKDYTYKDNTWETYVNVTNNDLWLHEDYCPKNSSTETVGKFKGIRKSTVKDNKNRI
jgi:hypothetical protein